MAPASKVISFVVSPQVASQQRESLNSDSPAGPEPKKYTIEQAFNCLYDPDEPHREFEDVNVERAIRAVAALLHFCSEFGNEAVDGNAANGLGYILEKVASTAAQTFRANNREIEWAKGRR